MNIQEFAAANMIAAAPNSNDSSGKTKRKITLFYDTKRSAGYALESAVSALQSANVQEGYELELINLDTAAEKNDFARSFEAVMTSYAILFCVENLPSQNVLKWIDRWIYAKKTIHSSIIYLSAPCTNHPDDHALICSYFRAVAFNSGREFFCGDCEWRWLDSFSVNSRCSFEETWSPRVSHYSRETTQTNLLTQEYL